LEEFPTEQETNYFNPLRPVQLFDTAHSTSSGSVETLENLQDAVTAAVDQFISFHWPIQSQFEVDFVISSAPLLSNLSYLNWVDVGTLMPMDALND